MPKIYQKEPGRTTGTDEGGPVKKTFGVYDRTAKSSRALTIAMIIAAVLFLIVVAAMLLR
jgi:hypothetical protein